MTDEILELNLERAARFERKITQRVLRLITLAQERKLFAKRGYDDIVTWLVERFKYSETSARRRVRAAALLKAVPSAEEKVATGDVNLTTLSLAQSAIRRQEKKSGQRLSSEKKAEVVQAIENKSASKAEISLLELLPDAGLSVERDHRTLVDAKTARMAANFPLELLARIEQIRDQIAHKIPNAGFAEVVEFLVSAYEKSAKDTGRCCSYQDAKTGKVCGSTYMVEEDHILPKALGGCDNPTNKRWLCRVHNQLEAEQKLGWQKANEWRVIQFAERRLAEFSAGFRGGA